MPEEGLEPPDTRILIPRRFGSAAPFEWAGGQERGQIHCGAPGCGAWQGQCEEFRATPCDVALRLLGPRGSGEAARTPRLGEDGMWGAVTGRRTLQDVE